MNGMKPTVIGMCALTLTALTSAKEHDVSTEEENAITEEYEATATEQQLMHATHIYTRGTQTYSVGWSSGGAQYGEFYGCKGKGVEKSHGYYLYDECAVVSFGGDAGNWLNSPDGRFFYIQNIEYMGFRIFDLIDIEILGLVPNLKVPSVRGHDDAAFGPDPTFGEVGFSNNGDTLLVILHRASRTELLIYDRTTPSAWALRESLSMGISVSGVYPVEKAHALLWTHTGNLWLYDIENKKSLWTASVPILADDSNNEFTQAKVVVVSPNLQFALFVSELGSALVAIGSGEVMAMHMAGNGERPSMDCTTKTKEIINSLPRSPGRCGQLFVHDDGSASVKLQSGGSLRLGKVRTSP